MCRNERAPVRGATIGPGARRRPACTRSRDAAVSICCGDHGNQGFSPPRCSTTPPTLLARWVAGRPRPASLPPLQAAVLPAHQCTHPTHAVGRQRGCWAPAAGGGAALCSPTNLALCSAAALWFDATQQQRQRRCRAAAAAADAAGTASPAWRRGGPTRFCGRGCPCWA